MRLLLINRSRSGK